MGKGSCPIDFPFSSTRAICSSVGSERRNIRASSAGSLNLGLLIRHGPRQILNPLMACDLDKQPTSPVELILSNLALRAFPKFDMLLLGITQHLGHWLAIQNINRELVLLGQRRSTVAGVISATNSEMGSRLPKRMPSPGDSPAALN